MHNVFLTTGRIFHKLTPIVAHKIQMLYFHNTSEEKRKVSYLCNEKLLTRVSMKVKEIHIS